MVSSTSRMEVLSPYNSNVAGEVYLASSSEIESLIDAAARAQKCWADKTVCERSSILEKAAGLILAEKESLARVLACESGKIIAQSRMEIFFAASLLNANAEALRMMKGELLPTDTIPNTARDIAWAKRVPLGTIAVILPFNFPVELLVEKAAAALAMGNAVVVKTPEQTPLAVNRVIELMHDAGVPREVIVAVNGGAEAGAAVARHPAIRAISLTGSTRAGIAVAKANIERLPVLHLELGGNDAAILLEDADITLAAPQLVYGRTLMNGQACASNKRIIVHRSLHDKLVEKLAKELECYVATDPLDDNAKLGPLVSAKAAKRVEEQVAHATGQGAKLAYGTGRANGALFNPVILANVPERADVAKDDEIFGPIFTLIPFDTDDEALRLANQSSYGLSGCVFSTDLSRALGMARRMRSGGVVVNGTGNYRPPFVPFGGVGMSGLGREGIGYTMEALSQLKYTVLRNILPE
jgi:acyl-CoA reductase-like NAD-dependent aldehyde dehydrogenase